MGRFDAPANSNGEAGVNRNRASEALNACEADMRSLDAQSLYLFGSTARDLAKPTSDLDRLIDDDRSGRFNAFDLLEIKVLIEQRLGTPVDITTRDGLHPRLRAKIEREAIKVF
jgi:hypothetical protein